VRPWSTVLQLPTDAGDLWFKANMPAQAFEAGVVEILAARRPDLVPSLLAVEPERGWMLQADGGTLLRGIVDGTDHAVWVDILPRYAELQIEAVSDRDRLLGAGAPDRTLRVLPAQFAELLGDREALHSVTDDELRRLRALMAKIETECAELAAFGIPETIQHDDLHDGQVFVRDGGYVFFDWGDSCVSHPFYTLVVTLAVLAYRLGLEHEAPELERFRDAYLEPWTRFASRSELEDAFALAYRLGVLSRGLTWAMIVGALARPLPEEEADAVPERMRMLLEVYEP
jgi:Phosphotransferase enzyme family